MLTYIYGDIFYSPARVLVNPVNTVGAMGKGLAYDFKRFYPAMYDAYRTACENDEFDVGNLLLYTTPHRWVLNFPTKKHYRAYAKPDYIEAGLQKFAAIYAKHNMVSVSFPALGTGEGRLDWETEVRPLMEAYLEPLPITIYVHIYDENAPFMEERRNIRKIRAWLKNPKQDVPFTQFTKDLMALTRKKRDWQTLGDEPQAFSASASVPKGRKKLNLKLNLPNGETQFISISLLQDLWQYIQRAGYVLPYNLPGNLDEHADYLITMLAELDYMRPVQLGRTQDSLTIGLHYIPPANRKATANTATMMEPHA